MLVWFVVTLSAISVDLRRTVKELKKHDEYVRRRDGFQ